MPGLVPGIHVLLHLPQEKTWMAGTSPAMTERERGEVSVAPSDMVGEHGGVVADTRQEGGVHFRQPLQAEEIQPRYAGDAVPVNRFAARIEHGNIDPAEIDAVAGGPDH